MHAKLPFPYRGATFILTTNQVKWFSKHFTKLKSMSRKFQQQNIAFY
jgi:hypothetical protein